jgi:non-heme chloroperoxidase
MSFPVLVFTVAAPSLYFAPLKKRMAMKNSIGALLLLTFIGSSNLGHSQISGLDQQIKVNSILLSTGVRLEYAEKGNSNGTPVIFLHGITDSWHSFEKILPLLPQNFHAFALSQRGHGNSDRPQDGYHPRDSAADVAAFVRQKNLGKVVVVGHSMGSLNAQKFVLDYPQLVRGIVLVGADSEFKDNPGFTEFQGEVSKIGGKISREFMEAFQKSTLAVDIDPDYLNTIIEEGMKVPGSVFRAALNGMIEVDYTDRLKTVQVPVLIIWGDKDTVCFEDDQELLKKNLKKSRKIVYAGTGHAVHWEKPERFAQDISEFITDII